MKILKNQGHFKILAEWPSKETNEGAEQVLEKAGRTCYQSEKSLITKESAAKFCSKITERTHYSVLEHGWRGYIIDKYLECIKLKDLLKDFWPITKFLFITERKDKILVSANLETWRKLYCEDFLLEYPAIKYDLEHFCPSVFSKKESYFEEEDYTIPITSIDQLHTDEERLNHIAHTVQYNDHSRGFTHEFVRHRIPSQSQKSTRYVDESEFKIILPKNVNENENIINSPWFELNEQVYKSLREKGWKPEDARQCIPIGIESQIVSTCNLLERRYIYFRRTPLVAHWEIRKTMCDELKIFKQKWPELFSMFEYKGKSIKDDTDYYSITCNPDIFCNG